jgi:hypothetical protein
MVEHFGIQDHDPTLTQHALQNPTNPSLYQNIGGGEANAPLLTPRTGDAPSLGMITDVFGAVRAGRKRIRKKIPVAVILALLFGPFGLIYTTWMGAIVMTALTAFAGFVRGGSMAAISSDVVMQPIWKCAVVVSIVWTILAARAHNTRIATLQG